MTRKAPSTWREGDKMTFEEAERGINYELIENNPVKKEEQIQMNRSLNMTGIRLNRKATTSMLQSLSNPQKFLSQE